jgi:hypothetical protein
MAPVNGLLAVAFVLLPLTTSAQTRGGNAAARAIKNPVADAMWALGGTDGEIYTVIANGAGPNSKMVGFKGKMPDQDPGTLSTTCVASARGRRRAAGAGPVRTL